MMIEPNTKQYMKKCLCGHPYSSHLEKGKEADCIECACSYFKPKVHKPCEKDKPNPVKPNECWCPEMVGTSRNCSSCKGEKLRKPNEFAKYIMRGLEDSGYVMNGENINLIINYAYELHKRLK